MAVQSCPIDLRKIELQPGQTLGLNGIEWAEFEQILTRWCDRTLPRLAYHHCRLELRMPLPEHEKIKRLIVILIELVLDALELDWEPYGSTTLKRQDLQVGIELDDCFYIQNAARMVGLGRLDLTVDPPPDLAIEIDITSPTHLAAYAQFGVPELWRYQQGTLEIWQLRNGIYEQCDRSAIFPQIPILDLMAHCLPRLTSEPVSRLKRDAHQWIQTHLIASEQPRER
ncbi:Uma2 family endonuclease [Spirulina major]|uniref:Uma2 family endonuclease n=1 Tax=Spirulina major TaxID=270636 RepID=UPI0009354AFE|nr:Uma2 family endonuclease [Spirulina major]